MLALETLSRLPESSALPARLFSLERVRRIRLDRESTGFYREIARHAGARSRTDIVAAVQDCLRWNRRRQAVEALAARLERIQLAKRLLATLTRWLYRGAIE